MDKAKIETLRAILAEMDKRSMDESLPESKRRQYAIKHARLYRYLIQVEDTINE